jgi:LmbE family N-acetylglucosaminyl deacetylase
MNHHLITNRHDDPAGATRDGALPTAYANIGNVLTKFTRPLPQRLLGVWAHPDDEAYLSAGLMARVVDAGGHVTIVTATRGEKGTDDPADYDQDHFGAARERELRTSLAVLGVHDVRIMGHRDGECDIADDPTAIDHIADVIADVVPDTIVTFGPDGMTYHADHRALSRWTTEAWRRTTIGELYYATVSHDWAVHHRSMHDAIGVYADLPDGRPASVGRAAIALECSLDDAELDRKREALAAHASQTTGLVELMGERLYRSWWRDERFRRPTPSELARCPVPDWVHVERELVGAAA